MEPEMTCRPRVTPSVRNLIVAFLAVVSSLAAAAPAQLEAQSKRPSARVWIAGGVGIGGSTYESASDGVAASVALGFQRAPHQFTLRYIGMIDPYDSSGDMLGEVSALYWRVFAGRFGHAGIGSGVAFALHDYCATRCETHVKPALPISFDFTLRVLPV